VGRFWQFPPDINPANTDEVIAEFSYGDASAVDQAVAAAKRAAPGWAAASPHVRHDVLAAVGNALGANAEEYGRTLAREEGKTLPEAIGEVGRASQVFKFFAGEALRLGGQLHPSVRPDIDIEVTREPVGIVGLITPWNFPIAIPAWKSSRRGITACRAACPMRTRRGLTAAVVRRFSGVNMLNAMRSTTRPALAFRCRAARST